MPRGSILNSDFFVGKSVLVKRGEPVSSIIFHLDVIEPVSSMAIPLKYLDIKYLDVDGPPLLNENFK